jgi:hypothetical protein
MGRLTKRIVIEIAPEVYEKLKDQATFERRTPQDCAAIIVEQGLGFSPASRTMTAPLPGQTPLPGVRTYDDGTYTLPVEPIEGWHAGLLQSPPSYDDVGTKVGGGARVISGDISNREAASGEDESSEDDEA